MPKVSVVIPVYNVSQYIEKCAHSLFGQTLDNIEYLFIDDCTPDDSIDKLKAVIAQYPNRKDWVRIIRMPQNSGQAEVRRKGIQSATGEYLIHCDSDDWLEIDAYEQLYVHAVLNNSDITFYEHKRITSNGSIAYHKKINVVRKDDLISIMLSGYNDANQLWGALVHKTLYRRKIIYPVNNIGEDFAIMIQYVFYSQRMTLLRKCLYNYRINSASITKSNMTPSKTKVLSKISNRRLILKFLERQSIKNKNIEKALEVLRYRIVTDARKQEIETDVQALPTYYLLTNKYYWYYLFISNKFIQLIKRIVRS